MSFHLAQSEWLSLRKELMADADQNVQKVGPHSLLVRLSSDVATMEISMQLPQES